MSTSGTLADLVLDRQRNPLRAFHVLSFIAMYGVFMDTNGYEPRSDRELAGWAGASYATVSRWHGHWSEAFPEYVTPALQWSRVREQLDIDPERTTPEAAALTIGAASV